MTRNLPNGYVATAGGVKEMELNAQTTCKYCSSIREKQLTVMVDCSGHCASW